MPTIRATRFSRIIHVLYPGAKLLDVTGPLQVFHDTLSPGGEPFYENRLVSVEGGASVTDTGVQFDTCALRRLRVQRTDIVLVSGGPGVFEACQDARLVAWLRRSAPRARIVASTCTGAFLLAAAGLLDGRDAVTHWDDCPELQRRHPSVRVAVDPIFVQDGSLWTSAGVTAGIDLSLALVENDLGREAALDLASRLVVHSKRSGGQSQFSQRLRQQIRDEDARFEDLHLWVSQNLTADLRVERLARRMNMSPRTFQRTFTRETGITPARMVTVTRLEAARTRLEESTDGVRAVAIQCGFGTEERMRRSFRRELGVSPTSYREARGCRP